MSVQKFVLLTCFSFSDNYDNQNVLVYNAITYNKGIVQQDRCSVCVLNYVLDWTINTPCMCRMEVNLLTCHQNTNITYEICHTCGEASFSNVGEIYQIIPSTDPSRVKPRTNKIVNTTYGAMAVTYITYNNLLSEVFDSRPELDSEKQQVNSGYVRMGATPGIIVLMHVVDKWQVSF